jgi:hypothetical protein
MIVMFEDDRVITANKEDILQTPTYELNKLLMDYSFNISSLLRKKIRITILNQICEATHRTQNIKLQKKTEIKLHRTLIYRCNFHTKT